jgi:hypothetical protein
LLARSFLKRMAGVTGLPRTEIDVVESPRRAQAEISPAMPRLDGA